jgi:uncharacterized membrane protein (UPF0127 family)
MLPLIIVLSLCTIIFGLSRENIWKNTETDSGLNSQDYNKEFVQAEIEGRESIKIDLELAQTDEELQNGLMGRRSLGNNSGMLFVFDKTQNLTFWMKDTFIPLDIAFLDQNKTITSIYSDAEPLNTAKRYKSSGNALYVIEMNAGWFNVNSVKIGENFNFDLE